MPMRLLTTLFFLFGVLFMSTTGSAQSEHPRLVIDTTKGRIVIEMLPEVAPRHVARITELAEEGFYDGIIFHRVIPGFMAQTGDPTGTGRGGSGKGNLPAEFSDIPFERGIVGMARTPDPNSADSQFFIMTASAPHLNGQYTVWGRVVEGMEVVDHLAPGEPPAEPDRMLKVRVERNGG